MSWGGEGHKITLPFRYWATKAQYVGILKITLRYYLFSTNTHVVTPHSNRLEETLGIIEDDSNEG